MAKFLNPPTTLKEADKNFVNDVIELANSKFKGDLFGEINNPLTEPCTTSDGLYHWSSNKDFLIYVTTLTETNDIRSASNVLYETLSTIPEYSSPTMVGSQEGPSGTTSTEEIRGKEAIERNEKAAKQREQIRVGQKAAVEQGLNRQQEIKDQKLKDFQKKAQEKNATIGVKVEKKEAPTLEQKEEAAFVNLKEEAVRDPEGTKAEIAREVAQRFKEVGVTGDTTDVSMMAAEFAVADLAGTTPILPMNYPQVAKTPVFKNLVAQDAVMRDIALQNSGQIALARKTSQRLFEQLFGKDVANKILPDLKVSVSGIPKGDFSPMGVTTLVNTQFSVPENPNAKIPSRPEGFARISVQHRLTFPENASKTNSAARTAFQTIGSHGGLPKRILVPQKFLKSVGSSISNQFANLGSWAKINIKGLQGSKQGAMVAGGAAAALAGAGLITTGASAAGFALVTAGSATTIFGFVIAPEAVVSGSAFAGIGAAVAGAVGAIFAFTFSDIIIPIAIGVLAVPFIVAIFLFIINSGAYVVPQGSSTGNFDITCKTAQGSNQLTLTSESSAANAAICIVSYLNQFHINPLTYDSLLTPGWKSLTGVLPEASYDALQSSATYEKRLQCIGFVSATAGLAYGNNFGQVTDACFYQQPNYVPHGYSYVSGTGGIKSGDIFIMDIPQGTCDLADPGHIGIVLSVDGVLITCADANYIGNGEARTAHGCFSLSDITGYLRKQ